MRYTIWTDDLGEVEVVEGDDPDDVIREYIAGADFPAPPSDEDGPWEYRVAVLDEDRIEVAERTIWVQPEEPECPSGEHEWVSLARPQLHGGGVYYSEEREHCGLVRTVSTWPHEEISHHLDGAA